jgi:hypothetical protein
MDAVGKLLGLLVDRALGLHPEQVGIRREGNRPVDGARRATLVACSRQQAAGMNQNVSARPRRQWRADERTVVALARPGRVPAPVGRLLEAVRLGGERERSLFRQVRRLGLEAVNGQGMMTGQPRMSWRGGGGGGGQTSRHWRKRRPALQVPGRGLSSRAEGWRRRSTFATGVSARGPQTGR